MLTNGNLILNSALLTIYNQITGQKSWDKFVFLAHPLDTNTTSSDLPSFCSHLTYNVKTISSNLY